MFQEKSYECTEDQMDKEKDTDLLPGTNFPGSKLLCSFNNF